MIRKLRLNKAVWLLILGVIMMVIAVNHTKGSKTLLAVAGILFIAGAFMLIYPVLFARKIEEKGKDIVELTPVGDNPTSTENTSKVD
ncbi:isoleucyl-tRNA synthetase [Pedobacter montanisoli]|uniref:Isoleucyl-tRNA synthetase n=1 Tax=Pedobacter montanisoli TaxID=2923277 RepID=A0ABS9ZRI1_9SPHI|nr:isoleucyl-tRNA synthetase [Pedobacter montanisoli]MCJ0741197.1 isoleucyl-tRNA synthetase [Pedobacter montanisoli]